MLVWTVPEDSASRGVWLIGGGGVKTLLFCWGTAYSMSSMEDIENSWSLRWQWKHATQNYYLCFQSLSSGTSANQCFPLRRAYLFMFLWSHPLLIKAPIREHLCHFYALLLTVIEYDCDWIFFAMNYNVQSALGLWRCSTFMFCGLRKS